MGKLFLEYFSTGGRVYTCQKCDTHLTQNEFIISKQFTGSTGKAYLFSNVVNVTAGPKETRRMITGLHQVCNVYCKNCEAILGWRYEFAYEKEQKYKEGKYILEKKLIQELCTSDHSGVRE